MQRSGKLNPAHWSNVTMKALIRRVGRQHEKHTRQTGTKTKNKQCRHPNKRTRGKRRQIDIKFARRWREIKSSFSSWRVIEKVGGRGGSSKPLPIAELIRGKKPKVPLRWYRRKTSLFGNNFKRKKGGDSTSKKRNKFFPGHDLTVGMKKFPRNGRMMTCKKGST